MGRPGCRGRPSRIRRLAAAGCARPSFPVASPVRRTIPISRKPNWEHFCQRLGMIAAKAGVIIAVGGKTNKAAAERAFLRRDWNASYPWLDPTKLSDKNAVSDAMTIASKMLTGQVRGFISRARRDRDHGGALDHQAPGYCRHYKHVHRRKWSRWPQTYWQRRRSSAPGASSPAPRAYSANPAMPVVRENDSTEPRHDSSRIPSDAVPRLREEFMSHISDTMDCLFPSPQGNRKHP